MTLVLLQTMVVIVLSLIESPTASTPKVAYTVTTATLCVIAPSIAIIHSGQVFSNIAIRHGAVFFSKFVIVGEGTIPLLRRAEPNLCDISPTCLYVYSIGSGANSFTRDDFIRRNFLFLKQILLGYF